ncbi:MAG: SUMF1/EgtB/PvdO family nonheme iron enzyme [Lentisphaeria bacterium]|nr:SUMF1/EgtB/PvdO family nonheme iron enzyme [Lentisphaeria bacterium]
MAADSQQATQDSQERARNLKFQPGDLIVGRYEYICELDRYGAGGVVCLCRDTNAGGTAMAVKTMPDILRQNVEETTAIQNMFKRVFALNHEGIAAVRSFVEDDFRQYVIMDYVTGLTLVGYMKDHPRIVPLIVEEIVKRLASALDYAHGRGMIHRNIKPGNVMVDIDDHGIVRGAKILDFGVGQQIRESVARVTGQEVEISHDYFSPEQWRNAKLTAASDQYSLAVLAYEMLSGRRPFKGDDPEALKKAVLEGVPKEIKGVPRSMNAALLKALSTNPSHRYANCSDFARAFAGEKVVESKSKSKPESEPSPGLNIHRLKTIVTVGVAVIAIVAVVSAFLVIGGGPKPSEPPPMKPVVSSSKPSAKPAATKPEAAKPAATEPVAAKPAAELPETPPQPTETQLTPEQAKQKQETLLLRSSMIRMQQTLAKRGLNRGQTFGTHLDTFADQLNAGDAAIKHGDYVVAGACFEAAKKEYEWLDAAIQPRQDAMAKLVAAEENIKKAEKADAAKFVFEAFDKAKKDFEDGRKAYESGDFAKALGLFEGAAKASETVFTEARTARLNELVMEAKKAEAAGTENDWKKVLNLVKDMKPLDAAIAEEWLAKADAKLPSTMTIVAVVDGREVAASVDGTDVMTPWKSPVLKTGSIVSHYLVWWKGSEEYVADFSTAVDWKGHKQEKVVLRKKALDLRRGYVLLPGKIKLELMKVEKGSFEIGHGNKTTGKSVSVNITRDYWIGKYEVSQGQWKTLKLNKKVASRWEGDVYPVENVSWNEAMAFCSELNQLAQGQLPHGYRFSLPTEAEWEFAARGGVKSHGYEYSGGNMLENVGWFWLNAGGKTHPVKGKKLKMGNELGIYDMSGNVLEWCRDSCDIDTKNLAISAYTFSDGVSDPICRSGAGRVVRGGSWQSSHAICRNVYRFGYMSGERKDNVGFRVVLSPVR